MGENGISETFLSGVESRIGVKERLTHDLGRNQLSCP